MNNVSCDIRGVAPTRLQIESIDLPAIVLSMPAPRSFTTEHVVEIQITGNPLLLQRIVEALIESARTRGLPARHAIAGEFTYRAWCHGRIPLDEAESIASVIAAQSADDLAAARHAMHGAMHTLVQPVSRSIAEILALVESGIDFSDEEDVVMIPVSELRQRLNGCVESLEATGNSTRGDEPPESRPRVVFRGPANAGKSTLFNALLGQTRALVNASRGTTRDAIVESCTLPSGRLILLVDTPGDESTTTLVAAGAQQEADLVVWCAPCNQWVPSPEAALEIATKRDLSELRPTVDLHAHADSLDDLAQLASLIDLALTNEQSSSWSNRLVCTHRQRGLLLDAVARLNAASEVISQDRSTSGPSRPEEIAAELRHALDAIGAITGEVPPDDVLGLVFSSFCVGK